MTPTGAGLHDDSREEAAKTAIRSDLEKLIDKAWPSIEDKFKKLTRDYRFRSRAYWAKNLSEKPNLITTLYELEYGVFWHALDDWDAVKQSIEPEKRLLYEKEVVRQAENSETVRKERNDYAPGYDHPYIILLELYDEEKLSERTVDRKKLTDIVNRAFLEIAYDETPSKTLTMKNLGLLDSYMPMINLKESIKLYRKPLEAGMWVTPNYVKEFNRQQNTLSGEEAAKLAAPIVEGIFYDKFTSEIEPWLYDKPAYSSGIRLDDDGNFVVVDDGVTNLYAEVDLPHQLKPYAGYIKNNIVQERIRSVAKSMAYNSKNADEDLRKPYAAAFKEVVRYINFKDAEDRYGFLEMNQTD